MLCQGYHQLKESDEMNQVVADDVINNGTADAGMIEMGNIKEAQDAISYGDDDDKEVEIVL